MKVLRGGSAEVSSNKWYKFDIELDESDLQALVVKHNLDYDKLTVVQKFRLLTLQAEVFVTVQMEGQGALGETGSRDLMLQLNEYISGLPKVAA